MVCPTRGSDSVSHKDSQSKVFKVFHVPTAWLGLQSKFVEEEEEEGRRQRRMDVSGNDDDSNSGYSETFLKQWKKAVRERRR